MQDAKIKREAGIVILIVFILGLLVGCVGDRLWGTRVWGAQMRAHPAPLSQLGLTEGQQKQLDTIFNDVRPRFQALQAQHTALLQQTDARIRAVLTPEQQRKFDAMHAHGRDQNHHAPPSGPR